MLVMVPGTETYTKQGSGPKASGTKQGSGPKALLVLVHRFSTSPVLSVLKRSRSPDPHDIELCVTILES